MKISFEGRTIRDVIQQMEYMLEAVNVKKPPVGETILTAAAPFDEARAKAVRAVAAVPQVVEELAKPSAKQPVAKSVETVSQSLNKPVEKKPRTEKQLANDEKMRVAALARVAAKRAAKAVTEPMATEPMATEPADPFVEEPEVDPAEMVKIRLQTIEELQAAYANGHQAEVFELLSRFGNGAKSFRELPPESFVPIRRAIDLGALEGATK